MSYYKYIIGDQVSILNKRLDSPILYDNSEELYVNNIVEDYKMPIQILMILCYIIIIHIWQKTKTKKYETDTMVVFLDEKFKDPML